MKRDDNVYGQCVHGNNLANCLKCRNPLNKIKVFPATPEEVEKFEKDTPEVEMPDRFKSYWAFTVSAYLDRNRKKGITEFRISFQNDNEFIIHPLGKDGETLDNQQNQNENE
jgi:hypothetical protein